MLCNNNKKTKRTLLRLLRIIRSVFRRASSKPLVSTMEEVDTHFYHILLSMTSILEPKNKTNGLFSFVLPLEFSANSRISTCSSGSMICILVFQLAREKSGERCRAALAGACASVFSLMRRSFSGM